MREAGGGGRPHSPPGAWFCWGSERRCPRPVEVKMSFVRTQLCHPRFPVSFSPTLRVPFSPLSFSTLRVPLELQRWPRSLAPHVRPPNSWLYLSSTLGWVPNSNPNLGLEPNAGLGTISPSVVSYGFLGPWAGTRRGWRRGWRRPWVGGAGGGVRAGGGAVARCGMNCGVSVTGGGRGLVSGCHGLMAGGTCGGGSGARGPRACRAFCSCRGHREGW